MDESSLLFFGNSAVWNIQEHRVQNAKCKVQGIKRRVPGQGTADDVSESRNEKEKANMTKKEEYEQRTEKLLEPILAANHFELVDVEYVKEGGTWYLRAYIDKPGGITVDDCEIVNRELSDKLDEEDYVEGSYVLEVSSPGLGRPLKKERDFARSIGEDVEVHLFRMVERQKEFRGFLKAYDKDTVTLEDEDGQELVLERSNIALIRLAFDW